MKKTINNNRDFAEFIMEQGEINNFIFYNFDNLTEYSSDYESREYIYYEDQWSLLEEYTTPQALMNGDFTYEDYLDAITDKIKTDLTDNQDIDLLEDFIDFIEDYGLDYGVEDFIQHLTDTEVDYELGQDFKLGKGE